MSAHVDLINDMGDWKYCYIESGDTRITAYSDGRLEIPDTHHNEIEDVVSYLVFAAKWQERILP